jgi:hypothetical protein
MQLRSGKHYRDANVTVRKDRSSIYIKHLIFRSKCEDFIGELNDACSDTRCLHVLFALYLHINDNIDDIYSFILYKPSLMRFIIGVTNRAIYIIKDLVSEGLNDYDITPYQPSNNCMDEIRLIYNLRNQLHNIMDDVDEAHNNEGTFS